MGGCECEIKIVCNKIQYVAGLSFLSQGRKNMEK